MLTGKENIIKSNAGVLNRAKPFFQPKLTINQPNDIYEQEADAMADKVMRMPAATEAEPLFFQPKPLVLPPVQTKCSSCEHEEKLQRKEIEEEEEPLQLKPSKEFDIQKKCDHCEDNDERELQRKEINDTGPAKHPTKQKTELTTGSNLFFRPKLTINQPSDIYEQEADTVADKVIHMPEPSSLYTRNKPFFSPLPVNVNNPVAAKEELQKKESKEDETEELLSDVQSKLSFDGLPSPIDNNKPNDTALIQRKCNHCEEEEKKIQRKESNNAFATTKSPKENYISNLSGGSALSTGEKNFFESKMGYDFSDVRIHNDSFANQSAKNLNALAYTQGSNIVFGSSQYQPNSFEGKQLLAHELTHVVQQNALSGNIQSRTVPGIQRKIALSDVDQEALINPMNGITAANIAVGLIFTPAKNDATYKPGSFKYVQGLAALVKALIKDQYSPDLALEFIEQNENNLEHLGGAENIAKENEPFKLYYLTGSLSGDLIIFLLGKKIKVPDEIIEIIQAYNDVDLLYEAIKTTTPKWFTRILLSILVSGKKTWLNKFASLKRKENSGSIGDEVSSDYYVKLENHVLFYTNIIEGIRLDADLVDEPAYANLWGLPYNNPDAKIKLQTHIAGEEGSIDIQAALRLIQQCDTNITNAKNAAKEGEAGHKARLKLLTDAFKLPGLSGKQNANTTLSDRLNRYNADPNPSSLKCYPPLSPPLFELVANTAPVFSMSVEWPDFYEALGHAFAGRYGFELIRIKDETIQELIKVKEGDDVSDNAVSKANEQLDQLKTTAEDQKTQGETPGVGDVISQKYHRRVDYMAEDIETVIDGMGKKFGYGDGAGILTLDAIGNAFGLIGDVIGSFWQDINADRWEKPIPITAPGLYIVRATAFQKDIPEDATFVRAPSVAWLPVWVRSAENYSLKYLEQVEAGRENANLKLKDISGEILLKNIENLFWPNEQDKQELQSLKEQKEALTVFLQGSVHDQLLFRKNKIEEALTSVTDEKTKEALEKQKKELDRLIGIQKQRLEENTTAVGTLEAPFSLPVAFVSDEGSTRQLLLELIEKPSAKNKRHYFVSDLTSSKMGVYEGPEKDSREDAIQTAIQEYLSEPNRYGRGYCSISIPSEKGTKGLAVKNTFRVTSDASAIVIDSIENITSALSVILVAAAPFTGGASLTLMLPVGIIGAIPSAYRIHDRVQGDSFYLDYGTAMDIVNILSSVTPLAGKTAGALKCVNVARGFAILGLGIDGLGFVVGAAQTFEQIHEISERTDISPGTRRAMIMSAVGSQLQNIGLAVGGKLFESGEALKKNSAEDAKPVTEPSAAPNTEPVKPVIHPDIVSGEPKADNTTGKAPAIRDEPLGRPAPDALPDKPPVPAAEPSVKQGSGSEEHSLGEAPPKPDKDTPSGSEVDKPATSAAPETTPPKDLGTENGRKVLAEGPASDGHKIKVTEEGILKCSDCSLLRREYKNELSIADKDADVKKIRDDLDTADKIVDPIEREKAGAEIEARLKDVRNRKLGELQSQYKISDKTLADLQQQQVKPAVVEKLSKAGIDVETIAIYSAFDHGADIIASLMDAKMSRKDAERILLSASKGDVLVQINLLVSEGRLDNPGKLNELLKKINSGDKGSVNELNIAVEKALEGNQVKFGTQGDIVVEGVPGITDKQVLQVKQVNAEIESQPGSAFSINLHDAQLQLQGLSTAGKPKTVELPQAGYKRVADVTIASPKNAMANADRATLSAAIKETLGDNTVKDVSPVKDSVIGASDPVVEQVVIRNKNGVFIFKAPDFI